MVSDLTLPGNFAPSEFLSGLKVFSFDYLDSLIIEASASPRLRQHRNLHASFEDPCQRLFNALGRDTYIRPHRHLQERGVETLIAVQGEMVLILFDDKGSIVEFHFLGAASSSARPGRSVGVEIPHGMWHTVLAMESANILLEIKAGPFDPEKPKELAEWAPKEGSCDAGRYLDQLRSAVVQTP